MNSLGIGSVLSRAFSTWFEHFTGFFLLALLLTLPLLPLELAPLVFDTGGGGAGVALVGGLLRSVAGYLLTGVVVLTVFESLKGESGTIMESLQSVKSQLLSIVGAAIVISLIVTVGIMLCVIPGIYAALVLAVAIPVIVVERSGAIDALSRSNDLTNGHKGQIFVVYAIYFAIMFAVIAVTMVFTFLIFGFGISEDPAALAAEGELSTASIILAALVDHATDALIVPLQATLTTVIYHDLRKIKEDVAIDDMFPALDDAGHDGMSSQPEPANFGSDKPQGQDPVW